MQSGGSETRVRCGTEKSGGGDSRGGQCGGGVEKKGDDCTTNDEGTTSCGVPGDCIQAAWIIGDDKAYDEQVCVLDLGKGDSVRQGGTEGRRRRHASGAPNHRGAKGGVWKLFRMVGAIPAKDDEKITRGAH